MALVLTLEVLELEVLVHTQEDQELADQDLTQGVQVLTLADQVLEVLVLILADQELVDQDLILVDQVLEVLVLTLADQDPTLEVLGLEALVHTLVDLDQEVCEIKNFSEILILYVL